MREVADKLSPVMKISVVIPARNEEEFLPVCLRALIHQTVQDFEVIVVDSASADQTSTVARAFGARVIRLNEPGVGLARQVGFAAAHGEIILSTDADAVPPPDWVERLSAPLIDPRVVGSYGTLLLIGAKGLSGFARSFFPWFQGLNARLGRPLFCGPNFGVRADAFQAVGGFRVDSGYPREAEDVQLAFKLTKQGKVVFLRNLVVPVSARRFRGSEGLRYTGHHVGNYLRLFWFERLHRRVFEAVRFK